MPLKANIHVSLNRLRTQKSALELAAKKQKDGLRKARTRTLIQVGGLVDLTPLLAICNIKLGDDLQLEHQDKVEIKKIKSFFIYFYKVLLTSNS